MRDTGPATEGVPSSTAKEALPPGVMPLREVGPTTTAVRLPLKEAWRSSEPAAATFWTTTLVEAKGTPTCVAGTWTEVTLPSATATSE